MPDERVAYLARASDRYRAAHDGVAREVRRAWPRAKATFAYGMPAWVAKRPAGAPMPEREGTMDPSQVFVGLVERKAGLTVHFWYPGDAHLLGRHADALAEAGVRTMRGCLVFNRKGEFPVEAVGRVFQAARDLDAGGPGPAKGGKR